ncbi:hypothetical protein BV25DRAFT_1832839 [Artomyces pyxidatus]|uniref:Uncharacterized protein n=2 Tax=Artomyces pyxidatus TaxID=48021 RepID=A0ACB8SFX1_9AGAM|nr:hypothetical protein BV25DRAFT_1833191 [Artomyces pyxidatus]KAI0055867.1 hypothetical protein BV25DRAFT_1832839 [Artomyces pyxidatus]
MTDLDRRSSESASESLERVVAALTHTGRLDTTHCHYSVNFIPSIRTIKGLPTSSLAVDVSSPHLFTDSLIPSNLSESMQRSHLLAANLRPWPPPYFSSTGTALRH